MKRAHLIIEAVLAAGVIALFIIHFACNKKASCATQGSSSPVTGTPGTGSVAYVNIDSVFQKYDMYEDLKKELVGKKNKLEADMNAKTKNYQGGVQDYQNKVSKGLVTRAAAADMEQQLTGEQQKLMQLQQQYQMELAEDEQVMHRQMLNSVMEFLADYNKTKGYTYILGNSFGGNVLYADKKYDITLDVTKGLNAAYKTKKK